MRRASLKPIAMPFTSCCTTPACGCADASPWRTSHLTKSLRFSSKSKISNASNIKTKTMNIRAIIQKIKKSFSHQEELPNDTVLGFLHVLESVQEEGCSCDEVFTKIDEYVEREVDQKDAEDLM